MAFLHRSWVLGPLLNTGRYPGTGTDWVQFIIVLDPDPFSMAVWIQICIWEGIRIQVFK